jgi:hypothetical protein
MCSFDPLLLRGLARAGDDDVDAAVDRAAQGPEAARQLRGRSLPRDDDRHTRAWAKRLAVECRQFTHRRARPASGARVAARQLASGVRLSCWCAWARTSPVRPVVVCASHGGTYSEKGPSAAQAYRAGCGASPTAFVACMRAERRAGADAEDEPARVGASSLRDKRPANRIEIILRARQPLQRLTPLDPRGLHVAGKLRPTEPVQRLP